MISFYSVARLLHRSAAVNKSSHRRNTVGGEGLFRWCGQPLVGPHPLRPHRPQEPVGITASDPTRPDKRNLPGEGRGRAEHSADAPTAGTPLVQPWPELQYVLANARD